MEICHIMNKEEIIEHLHEALNSVDITFPYRYVLVEAIEALSQPSLPSNLEEAAKKEIDKLLDAIEIDSDMIYIPTAKVLMVKLARFGAEWLAEQGWKEVDSKNYPVPDKKKIYIVYTKEHYHLARVINHPKDDDLYQWKCTEFPNYRYDMCEGDKYLEIRRE